jgi:hypothetical protein
MLGGGEECIDARSVILGGNRAVSRKNARTKYFDVRVVALVVLGDGVAEPGQIPRRRRGVGLPRFQQRVGVGERRQPADQEVQLNIGRFLTPQGAVVVERRDTRLRGNVIRAIV